MWNFTFSGIQYHARWEIGDSISTTISFSIHQLFHCGHSTLPDITLSTQFSSSIHEKQVSNRETMKLAILY